MNKELTQNQSHVIIRLAQKQGDSDMLRFHVIILFGFGGINGDRETFYRSYIFTVESVEELSPKITNEIEKEFATHKKPISISHVLLPQTGYCPA